LHLSHPQVQKVIDDDRIDFVAFTGSVEGGRAIQKAVNHRFITAGLELGGKDPAYVCADADMPFAIENLVDGAFFNSGQSCCGIERIYVDENVFDEFIDGFISLTRSYVLGNPIKPETTLGPLVRKSAVEHAMGQVNEACRKGAKLLVGKDDFPERPSPYMPPQVLINVDHTMTIMSEESFAPVIGIMPVRNEEEAVRYMNDSQYGLTASIWTSDIEKAIAIGDDIETGTWFMNRCDYLDPALAWTGVKNSGKGCTLSSMGYDYLTRPKSFHLKLT
jgi:acyl-CoA reductase-like NAD-dependent aldehyde dehydrogenase